MKTVCTDVFQYDELSDDAKAKARDWYRNASEGDSFWSECIIDDAVTALAFLGWEVGKARGSNSTPAIFFSGFASQGNGACFEGDWNATHVNVAGLREHFGLPVNGLASPVSERELDIRLVKAADGLAAIAERFPVATGNVRHRGRYYHEHSTEFSFDDNDDSADDLIYRSPEDIEHGKLVDAALEDFKEYTRDAMDWIYRRLEAEYNFQNSDEVIADTIMANEYTFTETGERFN